MKVILRGSIIALALIGSGCYGDDEDYSYRTENCVSVDDGDGQEYELCCRLSCRGEYDYDDFEETCKEQYSCDSVTTDDPCPADVIDRYRYPDCIY